VTTAARDGAFNVAADLSHGRLLPASTAVITAVDALVDVRSSRVLV
jgi:hypothetical protein